MGDSLQLTLPPAAAEMVKDHYSRSKIILEYGSGGSTALALETGAEFVMSVETDKAWARSMQDTLSADYDPARFEIFHVDIGKTRKWGRPVGTDAYRSYYRVATDVWDQSWFRQPDVVLVDGRLRTGCFFTTMLRTQKPVTVLFDDYFNRPAYKVVERYFSPVDAAGRMAQFEVLPQTLDPNHLSELLSEFTAINK